MRTNCSGWVLFLLFVAIGSTCSTSGAQIWQKFLPSAKGTGSGDPRTTEAGDARPNERTADAGPGPIDGSDGPTADLRSIGGGEFALAQENGPWLIVAASFSGQGAEKQAGELARELSTR